MAQYRHYCERCHEEDGGDAIRCDGCGVQMCCNCATQEEIATEECAKCRGKSQRDERKNDAMALLPKVLPSMRKWYEKHVVNEID